MGGVLPFRAHELGFGVAAGPKLALPSSAHQMGETIGQPGAGPRASAHKAGSLDLHPQQLIFRGPSMEAGAAPLQIDHLG